MMTNEELEEAIKDTIKRYKEIIFGSDTPSCIACMDELLKQQIIDQKIYDQKLMEDTMRKLAWEGFQKNIVMDGDTMVNKSTDEVLNPVVDSTYWKISIKPIFIVFIDHKITCCRVEENHILNSIDTLGTLGTNFS